MSPPRVRHRGVLVQQGAVQQAGVEVPSWTTSPTCASSPPRRDAHRARRPGRLDARALRHLPALPDEGQGSTSKSLKKAEAAFSDDPGRKMAQWLHDLGAAGAFQEGFSSVGYADAQNLFTSGKAAMYNMGALELPSLATTELPKDLQEQHRLLHPADHQGLHNGRERVRGALRHRRGRQRQHLRPAHPRLPGVRARALPGGSTPPPGSSARRPPRPRGARQRAADLQRRPSTRPRRSPAPR